MRVWNIFFLKLALAVYKIKLDRLCYLVELFLFCQNSEFDTHFWTILESKKPDKFFFLH